MFSLSAYPSLLALELRHAWRSIAARPGFSSLAVLVLAAGLASALSIASFMNTLVLNPLPFADAEQLYRAGLLDDNEPADSRRYDELGSEEVLDWEGYLKSLAQMRAASAMPAACLARACCPPWACSHSWVATSPKLTR